VQLNCERADAKLERDHPPASAPTQGIRHLLLALVEGSEASRSHEFLTHRALELTSSNAVSRRLRNFVLATVNGEGKCDQHDS
jgi:hypothetical protein